MPQPQSSPVQVFLLAKAIPFALFTERTGLEIKTIIPILEKAEQLGFIDLNKDAMITTDRGKNFLNDLLELFLDKINEK